VVIKRVHRHLMEHRSFREALRNEARIASHIHHPHVVAVTDVLDHEGELLLVMPYIESAPLSAVLARGRREGRPLPVPVVARIVADVLAGLHAAHEAMDMRGKPLAVVHRDVSPENIIVGVDGASRLIDFGVAKAADALEEGSGSLRGKYAYMAPEQVRGEEVDRRADVFAAGIVLHEALTSAPLFGGETTVEALPKILEMPVPPPSRLRGGLPAGLDDVVLRALARDPARRFPTAAAFLHAREVAHLLEARLGAKLAARREELRAILDGDDDATGRLSRVSTDDTGVAADPAFGVAGASSREPPPGHEATAATPSGPRAGSSGSLAASSGSLPLTPVTERRWVRRAAWAGAVLVSVVAVGAVAARWTSARIPSSPGPHASPAAPAREGTASPAGEMTPAQRAPARPVAPREGAATSAAPLPPPPPESPLRGRAKVDSPLTTPAPRKAERAERPPAAKPRPPSRGELQPDPY
jgi:serine/threonine-protein kinase